jgi:hypothetical protein
VVSPAKAALDEIVPNAFAGTANNIASSILRYDDAGDPCWEVTRVHCRGRVWDGLHSQSGRARRGASDGVRQLLTLAMTFRK